MDEESLNASKRRKIEETVLQILETSDLETATESYIRTAAADLLGLDLSGVPDRRFVRDLVDSFLLSRANAILNTRSKDDNNINQINGTEIEKKQLRGQLGGCGVELNYDGKIICKLTGKRMVSVYDCNGRTMVSIRDFSIKDGNLLPEAGISLTPEQWSSFRNSFPLIQDAIVKLQSRVRSRVVAEQSEAEMTNLVADSAVNNKQSEASISNFISTVCTHIEKIQTEMDTSSSVTASDSGKQIVDESRQKEAGVSGLGAREQIPAEIKQIESDVSASEPAFPTQGQFYHTVNCFDPEQLIPIQTPRLDGSNYLSWRHYMQLFLRQSNLAYVLVEPCPSLSLNSEVSFDETAKVKAAVWRWIYDDHMCRLNILKSLCDSLFQCYSLQSYSAKELWEELKSVYDEDFGTKRSQINQYVHFQMVDGVSILDQVQELHKIANSITASGSFIDENFHVSVIISKLPPSWKELRIRLLREESLPLNMLMHILQVEEESHNRLKKEQIIYKKAIQWKHDSRFEMAKR